MAGGRPRAFDVDEALDRALEVFWRQGYEGTALSDLTAAMGINRPSLYATFGNKQALFRKVLDRYAHGPAAYAARALELPRARDVVEALVYGAIELTTGPDTPHGCINVRTAQACGPDAEPARHEAMTRRTADHAALRRRLSRAQAEGDLPPSANPGALAQFITTLIDGIAVQASGGASRAQLRRAAAIALHAFDAIECSAGDGDVPVDAVGGEIGPGQLDESAQLDRAPVELVPRVEAREGWRERRQQRRVGVTAGQVARVSGQRPGASHAQRIPSSAAS